MIWRKMATKIKERSGFSLLHILAAVLIIGVLAIPMAKWFMSTAGNIGTDQEKASAQTEKMEMQSIIQNYWQKMVDMSYDEFQAEIAAKGTKRTETLGNYNLTIEFSGDSQYANALCNVGTAAGANDRHCRRATITLVSKQNPTMVESFYATRVQPASLEAALLKIAKDIQDEDNKFNDYDKKTEADNKYACPWDYHLVSGKCVACDAPSNWKQYRSGNCTLGTCPTGKKANAARTGCEAITCSGRTSLSGDNCVACPLSGKEYYTASSGCAKSICPTGKKANAAKTGCEAIVCPEGQVLQGDNCKEIPTKICSGNGSYFYSTILEKPSKTCTIEHLGNYDNVWVNYGRTYGVVKLPTGVIRSLASDCHTITLNVPITLDHGAYYPSPPPGHPPFYGAANSSMYGPITVPAGAIIKAITAITLTTDGIISVGSC